MRRDGYAIIGADWKRKSCEVNKVDLRWKSLQKIGEGKAKCRAELNGKGNASRINEPSRAAMDRQSEAKRGCATDRNGIAQIGEGKARLRGVWNRNGIERTSKGIATRRKA